MFVRLPLKLLFFRRRPWMEARLSLVSSLGYTFSRSTPANLLLHRRAHDNKLGRRRPFLFCSCSTRGGGRSIIAAPAAIAMFRRYPQVLLRPLNPLLQPCRL